MLLLNVIKFGDDTNIQIMHLVERYNVIVIIVEIKDILEMNVLTFLKEDIQRLVMLL